MYKLSVSDRDYSIWSIDPSPSITLFTSPIDHKLFDGDTFDLHPQFQLFESPLRQAQDIPGILLLENNRSYGRTDNKKRLLYRCKPFNTSYPHFLIPYEIPMGFFKNFRNKYVTFRFDHWFDKHPRGILSQTIGDVDDLPSYYEYQLYCKQLHHSLSKSLKQCKDKIRDIIPPIWIQNILSNPTQYGSIEDCTTSTYHNKHIFSIDPHDCTDRDDALSITTLSPTQHKITVYIANVWIWLEAFELWPLLGNRIATIYLPDKKRNMLPNLITEQLCSLDANKECFVLAMDFVVEHGSLISYTEPTQKYVKITHQFTYDEESLLHFADYQSLERVTKSMDASIHDSHDVVAFWMMKMNVCVAKIMRQKEIGIFRTVRSQITSNDKTNNASEKLPKTLQQFIRIWEQKINGQYLLYNPSETLTHQMIGVSEYVHFTSPIRRMIDLVNHMCLLHDNKNPKVNMSTMAIEFMERFLFRIIEINETMNQIKKVQNDCNILYQVSTSPEILQNIYEASVISKISDHMYNVYIEELKWTTKVYCSQPMELYSVFLCQLYVFTKEEQLRKKIRVQIISKEEVVNPLLQNTSR